MSEIKKHNNVKKRKSTDEVANDLDGQNSIHSLN